MKIKDSKLTRKKNSGGRIINAMEEQAKLQAFNSDPKCDYLLNYKFKLSTVY
jgi:hypothetical protein